MSTINNASRDERKRWLKTQLLEIEIDELVESACTRGSWFRENFNLAPETSSFWTALPRYVHDCQNIPPYVSPTMVQMFITQAIQKYRREYK
jgi:hypothetical protein